LVDEGFIDPLLEPFMKEADVFMVTPKCLSAKNGAYEGNKTKGGIRYGVYWSSCRYPGHEKETEEPGLTLQGGFGAFDRNKFLSLDGYDDLYLPGRLEDADICLRAYKRGWKCLYEPRSVVYHEGGTSFHQVFGRRKTLVINWRNTYLFMWKNIDDRLSLLKCLLWLPLRLVYSLLSGKPEQFMGFFQSIPLWPKAIQKRAQLKRQGQLEAVPALEIFSKVCGT